MRRLPEIDLARIAPLPIEQKYSQLKQLKLGYPSITYNPTRRAIPDIVNEILPMFEATSATSWPHIESVITKACRSNDELQSNLGVARSIYGYVSAAKLRARKHEFYPLALGVGVRVEYWLPYVLLTEKSASVTFVDPRRTKGLTKQGRRFVFSTMHERIRVADPAFRNVELNIIQFDVADDNTRPIQISSDIGLELFSFEQLDQMVRETYEVWLSVLSERETEERRRAGGSRGGLL